MGGSSEVRNGLMVLSSGPGFRLGGRPGWAAGHPFAAAGRHDGVRGALAGGVNQEATTPGVGGHDKNDPRRPGESRRRCSLRRRQGFQGAYVAVAQRVEDELQLAPGCGDRSDVAAAAVGDRPGQARVDGPARTSVSH
jgi:hypothetical protein